MSADEKKPPPRKRGFAAMSEERRREAAVKGAAATHAAGKAYQWTSETAKAAAEKSAVSRKEKASD